MKVIIVHGTTSRPERSWFPWLSWQLLRAGQEVYVPRFPTPKGQEFASWKQALENSCPKIDGDTLLVGHSTGCIFLLRYLSEQTAIEKTGGLFLVSAFAEPLRLATHPHLEPILNDFVRAELDWSRLQNLTENRHVYHGENDPYVPLAAGKKVADLLRAHFTPIAAGLHLNTEAGFTEFSPVLNDLAATVASGRRESTHAR